MVEYTKAMLLFFTGEKPAVTEACDLKPCYKDYKWVSRGLGPCSKTCSRGIQVLAKGNN